MTLLANAASPLLAQVERPDAEGDAQDARADAILAIPKPSGTAPPSNAYSTASESGAWAPARFGPRRHSRPDVRPEEGAVR
jgi:hypothetical protein